MASTGNQNGNSDTTVQPCKWPPKCLQCLERNLRLAEAEKTCMAGKARSTPSAANILLEAFETLSTTCVSDGVVINGKSVPPAEVELTEFALLFIADALESAALVSSLSPAERKAFPTPAKGYKPAALTAAQIAAATTGAAMPAAPVAKRHHAELTQAAQHRASSTTVSANIGDAGPPPPVGSQLRALAMVRHYLNVCPVEHLLRVLAALPGLIGHFVAVNSSAYDGPAATDRRAAATRSTIDPWFWPRVQALLDFIEDRVEQWATPTSKYVSFAS